MDSLKSNLSRRHQFLALVHLGSSGSPERSCSHRSSSESGRSEAERVVLNHSRSLTNSRIVDLVGSNIVVRNCFVISPTYTASLALLYLAISSHMSRGF